MHSLFGIFYRICNRRDLPWIGSLFFVGRRRSLQSSDSSYRKRKLSISKYTFVFKVKLSISKNQSFYDHFAKN